MTRTDVVVGAGSGMGESVARRLAARGNRLLLADRDRERVERLAAELDGAEAVVCDLTSPTDTAELAGAIDSAGALGALVVTAGLSPTMGSGRALFAVNIVGTARLLRDVEPTVGAGSSAVLLASTAGHILGDDAAQDAVLDDPLAPTFLDGLAGLGVDVDDPINGYLYSKRAVLRLARRAAHRWGTSGGRVVSVSPGIIDTPMGRQEAEAQPLMSDMVSATALGRWISPDEVAAVVEFLVSDGASAVSGTDVLVDGGAPT